jgi:mannonate dehydratase
MAPDEACREDAMLQTWRWFGPDDPVSLENVAQAGASGVVTALHHMNQGEAWSEDEILKRRGEIERTGLVWSVVESIGVGEEIKTRSGAFRQKVENYKLSIRNAARAGVKTFCYNFMAITDWSRTSLNWRLKNGGTALRFDAIDFAAYDLFILERKGAEADYSPERTAAAKARFEAMTPEAKTSLERNLIDWLPARDFAYDRASFRAVLERYAEVGVEDMRNNLVAFVREISEVAEEEGARLAIHPDDPAFPIFGLPRVFSTAEDVRKLFEAVPSRACGVTLCAGSFGSDPANDLVAMAREFGPRVHFVHLRNVTREADGSFYEADHLGGDVDLVALIAELMTEERRRREEGRDDAEIPMRPDHGHLLGDDGKKRVNPGYSFVGRLKGLAELRGVMQTVEAFRRGRLTLPPSSASRRFLP